MESIRRIFCTLGILCGWGLLATVLAQDMGTNTSAPATVPSAREKAAPVATGWGGGQPHTKWGSLPLPEPAPDREPAKTLTPPQAGKGSRSATSKWGRWLRDNVKTRSRNAPERQSRTVIPLGSDYLNALFGGFQRGAGLSGGLEATTADALPAVEFRVAGLLSSKLYRAFEGTAYIPEVGGEKAHAEVWFSYLDRTEDRFYGIGPDTTEATKTTHRVEHRWLSGSLFYDFTGNFQAGLYVRYANTSSFRGENETYAPIDAFFSGDPTAVPPSRFLPGLFTGSEIITYGIYGELDRRDREKGLIRGAYLYGNFNTNEGLENGSFSDYGWVGGTVDGRAYLPLGGSKTSLALRGYTELKRAKGGSQIPFYFLSYLGGRQYVRGFSTFRFAGNNLLLGAVELRRTVYARSERSGVDVFAFGDAGQVWGDSRPATDPEVRANQEFGASNWKSSIGGGVQFRGSRRFGVRLAVGHSNEGTRLHFSFSPDF